ncbi:MAG: competence/damage-inducible protein A [Alphaproteobacteria bacterium]|nr:competence/damage-inducible protein A [Alphaproteobacteria bacterium]
METPSSSGIKTAAVLVIGDEILSGRTQDTNINYIARFLALKGIDLKEARVVGDDQGQIVAALNALRGSYDFVFSTGGIGPTHDDITADAIAAAFGVGIGYHPEAYALLEARYGKNEFNVMRRRMARIPRGATLIANRVSVAPGFCIGNVFVLAGVPAIARAMLEALAPQLPEGPKVHSVTITASVPEGRIAEGLGAIQSAHPDTAIGSYPFYREDGGFGVQLVVRSRDFASAEAAALAIESHLAMFGVAAQRAI